MHNFSGTSAHSAQSYIDSHKRFEYEEERANQAFTHTEELQKQTSILEEAKSLTYKNAEYVKQICEYVQRNEESSQKHFIASIIISSAALAISIGSFLVELFKG